MTKTNVEALPSWGAPVPGVAAKAALGRLTQLAASVLGSSASQVSVLTDVQTVVAGAGPAGELVGAESPLGDSLCAVTAESGGPLAVADAAADPRVSALPPVTSGQVRSYLGVPLKSEDGRTLGAVCVFDPAPRHWDEKDTRFLQQLADCVVAELEVAALADEYEATRARWDLAVAAGGIGTYEWNLLTGELRWDERLLDLFGYTGETFDRTFDAFKARLHPDDVARVGQALQASIDSCSEYQAEYRIVLPDGATRWVQARGRTACDDEGAATHLLGVAYDTTAVHEGEARIARVLESMSAAFFSLDRQWCFTYVNSEAERVVDRKRDELLGATIWEAFPAFVGSAFEKHYREAMEQGQPVTFEAYYPAPLDAWYEVRAWPAPDGLSVYFLDISDRRRAQEEVERAAKRATLLAELAAELAGTLDVEETLARLCRLVVPDLADWSIVTVVDADRAVPLGRRLRDVSSWHVEPALRPAVERYTKVRLPGLTEASLVGRAIVTGRDVVVPEDATETIAPLLGSEEAREAIRALNPDSVAVLPLRAHGRTLGVMSLFAKGRPGGLSDDALRTARDVASRAGLALENARLYAQQRHLAEELQRSLLTAPPEPDHMQVVVRYEPASEAAQVGGDWYDAFMQFDGATVLVIGDVVGHDTQATAAMGHVRALLRGIAATTGEGPAAVLRRLDEAMGLLQIGTTATAVMARLEQTDDERRRGVTRMRWSNAGHPPPMAIHADGSVVVLSDLAGLDADLLLGIEPSVERTESVITLDRGATVLLYTDGLVERRGQSLEEGLVKLRDILAELTHLPLDDLCDEVLVRMLPKQAQDDVAIAAIRLHRQDVPRPPSAGPTRVPEPIRRREGIQHPAQ